MDEAVTPVERLQAAIEKLEQLKAESTPGPWLCEDEATESAEGFPAIWTASDSDAVSLAATIARPDDFAMPRGVKPRGDMALIVTLHRTVDAQLAILRSYKKVADLAIYSPVHEHVLALADAILGSDQ